MFMHVPLIGAVSIMLSGCPSMHACTMRKFVGTVFDKLLKRI